MKTTLLNIHQVVLYGLVLSFLCLPAFITSSTAQQPRQEVREDFSDEELDSFAEAYEEVIGIHKESEEEMKEAIEEENLSMERFNEILTAQQDPGTDPGASAEEMAAFNNAAQKIISQRQETEKKVVAAIQDEGIEIDTYRAIMLAYQHSPDVRKKLDERLSDELD